MEFTLQYIAEYVGGEIVGDPEILIRKISPIESASDGDISFLANPKYRQHLHTTGASAVIVAKSEKSAKAALLKVDQPYLALQKAITLFQPEQKVVPGISAGASVDSSSDISGSARIGHQSVIESNCKIGGNTVIYPFVYIGDNVSIGKNCIIYPFVSIRENTKIGNNVIIHSGAVIGSDGFGFAFDGHEHKKIPQIGNVVIEDDVEIGANCAIDRAVLGSTVIHKGTKLDNLIQIAHNVEIGANTVIAAQAGISGSTKIGNYVMIGGQAGLAGHITIGDQAMLGAQAGVTKSVKSNMTVSGYPACEHKEAKKLEAYIRKLPDIIKRLKELEKKYSSK